MERTIGAGPISAERALNYGFTGPNLRAAGVDYDVRVHTPIAVMKILILQFLLVQPAIVMIVSWCGTRKCGKA